MGEEKFQPFRAGDWQSRQQHSSEKSDDEINFERNYPIFQRYLTAEDFSPIFQSCERTCIELDRIARTGRNEEASEAQHAINAYGRSMQLAGEILALKRRLSSR